jgi:HEAT repeat protein
MRRDRENGGSHENDSDEGVRETSVWAVGQHGDQSAAGALGRLLLAEHSERVKATAAWALGQLDVRTAPEGLVAAVRDTDQDVRLKAAWGALGTTHGASGVEGSAGAGGRDPGHRWPLVGGRVAVARAPSAPVPLTQRDRLDATQP